MIRCFFGTAISGDKTFLNSEVSLCTAARSRRSRCDVIYNSWKLIMVFEGYHDISQGSAVMSSLKAQPLCHCSAVVIVWQMGVVYAV